VYSGKKYGARVLAINVSGINEEEKPVHLMDTMFP